MAKYYTPDLQKYEYQKAVIDKDILTPPGTPAAGDRYLINGTGTGAWSANSYDITTWDGAAWIFAVKREGMIVWAKDEDKYYFYNGTVWAVAEFHAKSHAITSATDHTSPATAGRMLKADANGLPIDATNTDTDVADAVTKKHANTLDHTQGTDTTLGAVSADINMNTKKLTALAVPSAAGDSIRATTVITEVALEGAINKAATYNATLECLEFNI
ncbi:MAG: DUF2793 domain-containing protein [Methylococcales bacterium]|nr:DUF2793 domain-containing protein [Methylococcales bacterium]